MNFSGRHWCDHFSFSATNPTLNGAELVTYHPGYQENGEAGSVCVFLSCFADRNYHSTERKASLREQISCTLNVAGKCFAFMTLQVLSL